MSEPINQRVLITGAAGFLGVSLARTLLEQTNYQLLLVDNLARGRADEEFAVIQQSNRVQFLAIDLNSNTEIEDLPEVDWVIHLAAQVGVRNVEAGPGKVLENNVVSTFKILDYSRKCKRLKKVFFASTSEVYAGTLAYFDMEVPTPEDTPLTVLELSEARGTYSLSKIVGESALNMAAKESGLPIVIGRFHNVYGPRMGFMHVIPELYYRMVNNASVMVYSPSHTRSFCFVKDAIRMVMALTFNNGIYGTYNIGNPDEEIRMMDLAIQLKALAHAECTLVAGQETPGSPLRRCPNINRYWNDIGRFEFTDLEQGLAATMDWYKERLSDRYE